MATKQSVLSWKTYPMGGAALERMRALKGAHLSHAVDTDTWLPLCRVKPESLCMDSSLATNEQPDCPRCRAKIRAYATRPQKR